jgi:hypothetical protein
VLWLSSLSNKKKKRKSQWSKKKISAMIQTKRKEVREKRTSMREVILRTTCSQRMEAQQTGMFNQIA